MFWRLNQRVHYACCNKWHFTVCTTIYLNINQRIKRTIISLCRAIRGHANQTGSNTHCFHITELPKIEPVTLACQCTTWKSGKLMYCDIRLNNSMFIYLIHLEYTHLSVQTRPKHVQTKYTTVRSK